jgi:hypothetical protein
MKASSIFVKTIKFDANIITNLDVFKQQLKFKTQKGYCEKVVQSMTKVSNQKLCGGTNKNVGYFYRVTIPVGQNNTRYAFRTPTDFGHGGIVFMDGKMVRQYKKDIWQGGKSKVLDLNVTLDEGMHYLEIYGSDKCCDGTTSWSFSVNGSKW